MTIRSGARPVAERGQDVRQVRLGAQRHRRIAPDPAARRAGAPGRWPPRPRNRSRAAPLAREVRRELQQQRRFADARLAADEQRAARHEAAAGDALQFGACRSGCAACPRLCALQRLQRDHAARAKPWSRPSPAPGPDRSPRRACSTRRRTRICRSSVARSHRSSGRRRTIARAWPCASRLPSEIDAMHAPPQPRQRARSRSCRPGLSGRRSVVRAPMTSTHAPRRASSGGTSETSTVIRSIDTRPTTGTG